MTAPNACLICGAAVEPIYNSGAGPSVDSLGVPHTSVTHVELCVACGHVQTRPLPDLAHYYDTTYRIGMGAEDEDQLVSGEGGATEFRSELQARTFIARSELCQGARLLDVGAAKAATLHRIAEARPDVVPFAYDVSDMYRPLWRKFLPDERTATYSIPGSWRGTFDAAVSFFALEHSADPRAFVASVREQLRPGGLAYLLVPNILANIGDFVVCDHVNHFTVSSLERLLSDAGFVSIVIDEGAHPASLVVMARTRDSSSAGSAAPVRAPAAEVATRIRAVAIWWSELEPRVREFERDHRGRPAAIYGAGFYGSFLRACLTDAPGLRCVVDKNPHLKGRRIDGLPVAAPAELPSEVEVLYVGLNPAIAHEAIASIESWRGRRLACFFP